MDFFGIGPWEFTLILIVAVIFLGPGKIVEYARTLGKWVSAIKRMGNDFTTTVTREIDKIEKDGSLTSPGEIPPSSPHLNTGGRGAKAGINKETHT